MAASVTGSKQEKELRDALQAAEDAVKEAGTDAKKKKLAAAAVKAAQEALDAYLLSVTGGAKGSELPGAERAQAQTVADPPEGVVPGVDVIWGKVQGMSQDMTEIKNLLKGLSPPDATGGGASSGGAPLYQQEVARPPQGAGETIPGAKGPLGLMDVMKSLSGDMRAPALNAHQPQPVNGHPGFVTASGGYVAWQPEIAINHAMVAEQTAAANRASKKESKDEGPVGILSKEQPPYYNLDLTNIRHMMHLQGGCPLRVRHRLANYLLYEIFNTYPSVERWADDYIHYTKKGFHAREFRTDARAMDLLIQEMGWRWVEKSAACEVMLRRMHAMKLADQQGTWKLAGWIEELPTPGKPGLHETILQDLVTVASLYDKAANASGTAADADFQ